MLSRILPLVVLLASFASVAVANECDDDCLPCQECCTDPCWEWRDGDRFGSWLPTNWTDLNWHRPGDHTDPDDPQRHVDRGAPLVGTSWLNRPLYAGWFFGGLFGGELVRGRVDQGEGSFGGYHVGLDFDHYWGTEGRFGFANVDLSLDGVASDRTSRDWFVDGHLLYYPWGDSYWRPYLSLGLGLADFRFFDDQDQRVAETLVHIPIGIGVKCNFQRWLALRVGLTDNFAVGNGTVSTLQNISLTCGIEMRFGGTRTSYYPWYPGSAL